jgi:LmeA-like phospholipid-binding
MVFSWPTTPAGSALPQRSDVRVSLSDGYLTRAVQARLSSTGIVSIHGLQVRSAPPALVVHADAAIGPVSAPISVELQPVATGGAVQVRIIATHIGAVPVPNVLTGLVTGSINDSLRHTLGARATVTGVAVTQRGLDITANYP